MAAGRYCMKWACSARRRVRRKNFLKHPLTQKLLESLQEQIEKATAAFMLQDSIVLIFSQLYQIIHLLETHVRGKICWKATRGSAQNQSEWTWHIYAAACPILFFLFLSAPIASFISTLPFFLLKWNKTNQTNKNPQTKPKHICLVLGLCFGCHLSWKILGLINTCACTEKFWQAKTSEIVI